MNVAALRVRSQWLSAAIALCAVPAMVLAQEDAFKRGLDARGKKAWPAAVTAMQEAAKADGRESAARRIRIGGFVGIGSDSFPYLPYYFLGEALKNRGDCGPAVAAWEQSEDQKEIQKVANLYESLQAGYKECAAKGVLLRADYRQQQSSTDNLYTETSDILTRLTTAKTGNPESWRPEFDGEIDKARTELTAAQSRLVRARATRLAADFAESRSGSTRAAGILRSVESRIGANISARTQIQQQAADAQQRIASAEASAREIDASKFALPPQLTNARDSGQTLIAQAREKLGVAEKTQNAAAAAEAVQAAQQASDALARVLEQVKKLARADFEQLFQQSVAAATQSLSLLASSFSTLERLAAEKPDKIPANMTTEREGLLKEQSTLQRRFESARRSENMESVDAVTRQAGDAQTRLEALVALFGPATLRDRGVHASLEKGVGLYLSGDYRQALTALAPNPELDRAPYQGQVHLFRAASLYALYVYSGEKDQALRTDAIAEVERTREADPALQPLPRAFSPSFITFFQTAATATPQAAAPAAQR